MREGKVGARGCSGCGSQSFGLRGLLSSWAPSSQIYRYAAAAILLGGGHIIINEAERIAAGMFSRSRTGVAISNSSETTKALPRLTTLALSYYSIFN